MDTTARTGASRAGKGLTSRTHSVQQPSWAQRSAARPHGQAHIPVALPSGAPGGPLHSGRAIATSDDASSAAGTAAHAAWVDRIGSTGSCSGAGAFVAQHMHGSDAGSPRSPSPQSASALPHSTWGLVPSSAVDAQHDGTRSAAQQLSAAARELVGASGSAQHGAPVPAIAAIWQQHSGIQKASTPAMMVRHARVTTQEYATQLGLEKRAHDDLTARVGYRSS